MPSSGVNLGAWYIPPYDKADNPSGIIFEILRTAAGTSDAIYGVGNSSAGKEDCKKINTIIGAMAMPEADDADKCISVVSTTTTTDDTVTITTDASVAKTVFVLGTGQTS